MKKWSIKLGVAAALLLAVATSAPAAEFGFGSGMHNGHSYSGRYSVDPGYSFYGSIESGKRWSYGATYMYSHWTRTNNEPSVQKEQVNSHKMYVFGRYYLDFSETYRPFGMIGAGYEFAEDRNNPIAVGGVGLDYWITKTFGTEISWTYTQREDRNYRILLFGVKYRF